MQFRVFLFILAIVYCLFLPVYDIGGAIGDRNVVVLDDIRIDIMDYIMPAVCNDSEFRQMWTEFEWENKVLVLLFFSVNIYFGVNAVFFFFFSGFCFYQFD